MTSAVFTQSNSGMAEAEFDVEFRITYSVPDLIIVSACKDSKCGAERNQPHCAHAGRHINHIGFCDAAVKKPVRICFFESVCHSGRGKVSIQNDNLLIFFAQLNKGFAVSNTYRFLFHFLSPPILSAPEQPVQHSVPFRASQPGLP